MPTDRGVNALYIMCCGVAYLLLLHPGMSNTNNTTYPVGLRLSQPLTDGTEILAPAVQLSQIWVQVYHTITLMPLIFILFNQPHTDTLSWTSSQLTWSSRLSEYVLRKHCMTNDTPRNSSAWVFRSMHLPTLYYPC